MWWVRAVGGGGVVYWCGPLWLWEELTLVEGGGGVGVGGAGGARLSRGAPLVLRTLLRMNFIAGVWRESCARACVCQVCACLRSQGRGASLRSNKVHESRPRNSARSNLELY